MTLKEQKIQELMKELTNYDDYESFIYNSLSEMFDYAIDLAAENAKIVEYSEEDTKNNWTDSEYMYDEFGTTLIPSKQSILQLKTKEV